MPDKGANGQPRGVSPRESSPDDVMEWKRRFDALAAEFEAMREKVTELTREREAYKKAVLALTREDFDFDKANLAKNANHIPFEKLLSDLERSKS